MKKSIEKLFWSVFIAVITVSCAKYHPPQDAWGQECVSRAKDVENLCLVNAQKAEYECQQRNAERQNIRNQQIQRQREYYKKCNIDSQCVNAPDVHDINLEGCSSFRIECEEKYQKNYRKCGGRVEYNLLPSR